MGKFIFDKYSILHFSVGVIWRYLELDFISLIIIHTIFEIVENSKPGMFIINNYFKLWPGGKPTPDTIINSISDIIVSVLGWIIADRFITFKNFGWFFSIVVLIYFWLLEHYFNIKKLNIF